ncbi:MAG: GNAT family N-acetyltransferase, partial [Phycisphaerales bacterium]|nr:GNAT family N-acetyltransferase [Phycisphaerales bacterium]
SMTTFATQSTSGSNPGDAGPVIVRVDDSLRPLALARLLGVRPGDRSVRDLELAAASDANDLSQLWATLNDAGRPVHVALVMPSPGRTAMFFLSEDDATGGGSAPDAERLRGPEATRERARLLQHVCQVLRREKAEDAPTLGHQAGFTRREPARAELPVYTMGQSLLEPTQASLRSSFVQGGFSHLADLAYMRREIPRRPSFDPPTWPAGVSVRSVASMPPAKAEAALVRALTRSYIGTLDCPALCSLRTTQDVLASHRSVGTYDPAMWHVVFVNDEAEGCLLLSPCPAQQTVELVYIGLGPSARGMGLGTGLMKMGLNSLCVRAERWLACAVDEANTPARRLYESLRFRAFAKRVALVVDLNPAPSAPDTRHLRG